MFLEIVTPEASIFRGEVDSVTVPGVDGQFQMLNNHAPIVSLLQEGNVRIQGKLSFDEAYQDRFKSVDKTTSVLPIQSGTIELNDNKIIIRKRRPRFCKELEVLSLRLPTVPLLLEESVTPLMMIS